MTARDKAGAGPRKAGPDGRSLDPSTPPVSAADSTVEPVPGASGAWCRYCAAVAIVPNRKMRRNLRTGNHIAVLHTDGCPVATVGLQGASYNSAGSSRSQIGGGRR